jgi:hypothetical protein
LVLVSDPQHSEEFSLAREKLKALRKGGVERRQSLRCHHPAVLVLEQDAVVVAGCALRLPGISVAPGGGERELATGKILRGHRQRR